MDSLLRLETLPSFGFLKDEIEILRFPESLVKLELLPPFPTFELKFDVEVCTSLLLHKESMEVCTSLDRLFILYKV